MFNPTVDLKPNMLVLLGIGSDENFSFMRGPAQAPSAIRAALHSGSANLTAESGVDFGDNPRFVDAGDMVIKEGADAFMGIEQGVEMVVGTGALPLILGGDHAITYPVFRAVAGRYGRGASAFCIMTPIRTFMMCSRAIACPTPVPLPASWKKGWQNGWFRWAFAV